MSCISQCVFNEIQGYGVDWLARSGPTTCLQRHRGCGNGRAHWCGITDRRSGLLFLCGATARGVDLGVTLRESVVRSALYGNANIAADLGSAALCLSYSAGLQSANDP